MSVYHQSPAYFRGRLKKLLRSGSRSVLAGLAVLTLTACATTPSQTPGKAPQDPRIVTRPDPAIKTPAPATDTKKPEDKKEETKVVTKTPDKKPKTTRPGLTPPHMDGRNIKRLALLLPFSAESAGLQSEAAGMMKAAELAVFDRDEADVVMMAFDTQGTARGAEDATRSAIRQGADVILGPLLSGNVKASAKAARRSGTPVIGFSTDTSAAGGMAHLLSFPPEAEVARVTDYLTSQGIERYAFIGPSSAYGNVVVSAFEDRVRMNGGSITAKEVYTGSDISVMQEPAQSMAKYYFDNGGDSTQVYQAVMMPEGGTSLRALAPLLPYYDINPAKVQFIGTARWNNPETATEPALNGGLFAAPDREAHAEFKRAFERAYGSSPANLGSLAYDAVSIGAFVADGEPDGRIERLTDPEGFYGVDGLVRFNPDGTPDRGLAIYRINYGQFVVVDPAPKTVSDSAS